MVDDPTLVNGAPGRVSRFEILEVLGEGAMGVVYRARDPLLQRDVALKLIKSGLADEERPRARFLRECRAAATINHPGVATIYEAGETEDGRLFLASELVEGETLFERIDRDGALPPSEVVELGIQLTEALAAAHAKGAIHRDIKPANLMLTSEGRLKVLDFGLARLVCTDESEFEEDGLTVDQTQEGMIVGTPAYMSPEQAVGMKVDERTDIFSAGCVIYEMVTGTSPFQTDSVPKTLGRVLCEEPPSISSSADGIPPGLEEVLRGVMAKGRTRRTASAAEAAEALRALRETPAIAGWGLFAPGPNGKRRRVMFGSIAGLVVLTVAAFLVWQWSRPGLAFASSDRLLVADVENLTGDDTFDLALHTALETDLKQSPYASVYQGHQVKQTLGLMRRDADSVIDEELGRDICRFAGIRALVVPRIADVGDAYELSAAIVDPQTGRHVEQIRITAKAREDVLLEAIDELSRKVRVRLGETLDSIHDADYPVSVATTSSWEAMHYFASGNQAWSRGMYEDAAGLFELGLEIDPEFATCRGSLGLLLIQFLREPERGREALRQALVDGETLPRNEYLMLRAVNRHFVDQDLEGALAEYELINEIYPGNMAAYNNRGRIQMALRRFEEAVPLFEKASELDSKNAIPLINLAFLFTMYAPDPQAGEEVCRKLIEIDSEVANYHSLLGWTLAIQLRFDEALVALERALKLEPDHAFGVPNLAYVLMAMGNPESAVLYFRRALARIRETGGPTADRGAIIDVAVAMKAAGNRDEVTRIADREIARVVEYKEDGPWGLNDHAFVAQLYALDDRIDEAEEQLAIARNMKPEDGESWFEIARCCALLGHRECAIEETARALEMGYRDPFQPMLTPAMHDLLGDPEFMALFPLNGSGSS